MSYQELKLKLVWGDMEVELEGDATAVLAEIEALRQGGIGRIADFFALRSLQPAPSAPAGGSGQPPSSPARPDTPSVPSDHAPGDESAGSGPSSPDEPAAGSGEATAPPMPHGDFSRYRLATLVLPATQGLAMELGTDLDNDPRHAIDNKFGTVLALLSSNLNLDLSAPRDMLQAGAAVPLLRVQTIDPALQNDAGASVAFLLGGTITADAGSFGVDATVAPALFFGTLVGGRFRSDRRFKPPDPVVVTLPLLSSDPALLVRLLVHEADVEFEVDPDAGITNGRLHGGLDQREFQATFFPSMTAYLNERLVQDPDSETAHSILALFHHAPGSATSISMEELAGSSLFTALLQPDVTLNDGRYISFGVGFTAKKTQF